MERENLLRDLDEQISSLTRLHILHGLHETDGFNRQRQHIRQMVEENDVDVRTELDPLSFNLYRRYFG